jgi:3-oxoacyl-[acyl-carrier-protein] synthase-3
MSYSVPDTTAHLLRRLNEVLQRLDSGATALDNPHARFADVLDSMALVELLAVLAEDYGVTVARIEECLDRRFGTVAEVAARLHAAGWRPGGKSAMLISAAPSTIAAPAVPRRLGWLAATAARLPDSIQAAAFINQALGRPEGWLEHHAGIEQRRVWAHQDPLAAAVEAGRACLDGAGLRTAEVGALLVTSEAPPLLTGLAAALHHRLRLEPNSIALEIGGACTGFLAALWTAQALLQQAGAVLVVAVETPSRYLQLQPGPAGENAALFGDAAAATVLCSEPRGREALPLAPVLLGLDGGGAGLLQVELVTGAVEFRMKRIALASRAVEAMARSVKDLAGRYGLDVAEVAGVVAHGGNGRLPGLLARKLKLPADRVWSEAPRTGNLGSASLPVAWAARQPRPDGTVIWTAVGAGLTWGAAMVGNDPKSKRQ